MKGVFRKPPPFHLPRHLLLGVLTYRMQADVLGSLAPDTIRLFKELGSRSRSVEAVQSTAEFARRQAGLKPSVILIRECSRIG